MNRRTFLQSVACAPVLGAIDPLTLRAQRADPAFAYVGTPDAICVFAIKPRNWTLLETVPSPSPSFIAIQPGGKYLYAANDVDEHEGIPQGTVEAYAIDAHSGHLDFLNRRALSLSATRPRHLAISPDGKTIAVAAGGGGVYNVISIETNGALGKVTGIRKEVGCGLHQKYQSAAHPHSLVFHPAGEYLVATDLGCDRISSFNLVDGTLVRRAGFSTRAGSGPGALAFDPSGSVLYVAQELRSSISCHRYHGDTGEIEAPFQRISGDTLAISRDGKFIYSARASESTVSAWAIDPISGSLSQHDTWQDPSVFPCGFYLAAARLYAFDKWSGAIVQLSVDASTGKSGDATRVARVKSPRVIVTI